MGNDESTGGGVRSEVETKASENVRNREEAEGHGYDQFSSNGKCSTEGSDTSKLDSTLCVQSDAVVDAGVQSTCAVQIRITDSSKNAENVGRKEEPSPGTAVAESEHKAVDGDSEEGIALPYDGDCDSKLAVLKSPYDIPPEMAVGDKTVTKCTDPICVEENAAKKHLDVLNEAKSSVQSNPFVSGDTDDGKLPATCDSTVSETSGMEENSRSDKADVDKCLEGYKENETDIVGICNKGSAESSSEATVIHSSSPMSDPCNMKSMPYPDAKRRSSGVTEEDSSVAASALVPPPLEVIAGGSAAPYSSKVEQDSGSSTKRDNIGDANSAEGRQMITTSPIYQTPGSGKCTAEEFEAVEGVETKHESDTSGSPQQEVPNQRTSLPTDRAQITDITSNSLPEASKSERNTDVNSSPYFPEDFHCGKDPDTSSQYSNRSLSQFAFDSASIGSCPTEKSGSDSETSREMTPDSLVSGENKAKKLRKEHKARKLVLNNAASNIVSHFSIGHKIDSMFGSKKGKEKDGISIKSNGRSTSSFFSAADSISLSSRVESSSFADGTSYSRASSGADFETVSSMTDDEVNAAFTELLDQMNIKGDNRKSLLADADMEKKRRMVSQSQRLSRSASHKTVGELIERMDRALQQSEDNWNSLVELMKDVKVRLSVEKVDWIREFCHVGGLNFLTRIMKTLIDILRHPDVGEHEEEIVSSLYFSVMSLKAVVNTWPGVERCFRSESKMFACLVGALSVASSRPSSDYWYLLQLETLSLLAVVAFINDDSYEIQGRETLIRELSAEGKRRNCDKFRCIVDCMKKTNKLDVVQRALMLVNSILYVREVEEPSTDEAKALAEEEWQMRMHWRSEFMRSGMYDCVEFLEKCSAPKVKAQYDNFCQTKEADFSILVGRFEQIKGEYENANDCFTLLQNSVKNSKAENTLLSILQHLLLIPDDIIVRSNYLRLIENCISEIVMPKTCVDPDFRGKFDFTKDICDIVDTYDDADVQVQFNRRIEQATQAKNEALAKQSQYYKKMEEFREETKKLRAHIANPQCPLPEATSCTLPPPLPVVESASKASTSIPPPPPFPSSANLPPVTGGPPAPPPPPGFIPSVTGGPPPPPPPPGFGGAPPPPPPPPPGFLGSGGGPPPPVPGAKGPPGLPPGFLSGSALSPELPEYLKKKTQRSVEVPMKKIQSWGSATIKPNQIPRDSFWAQTSEETLASEKLFHSLKAKFCTSRTATNTDSSDSLHDTKSVPMKKKVKVPLVIKDDKVLQALAILQGSCKLPLPEWRRCLLEVDEKVLNAGMLQQLKNALPEIDTLKKLNDVAEKKFSEMPEGEQFAAKMASISGLPARLDAIIFMMRFTEIVDDLKPGISAIIEACDEIRTSKGFKIFLEMVLLVGNYMGHSSKHYKDTFAFEMSVLTKLTDTKDVDNSETLLHYLVEFMREQSNGRYAQFPMDDFMHVAKASRLNEDEIAKGVLALKQSTSKLEKQLASYKPQAGNDLFVEKLAPFLERCKAEVDIVEKMHNTMKEKWKSLRKYYAFDPKKYSMEQFFVDINTFKNQYEKAYRDIERAREQQEREEQRKQRAPFRQLHPNIPQSPATRGVKIEGLVKTGKGDAGVVDEIEKFLEGAYLKAPERRTPRNTPRSRAGRAALQRQRSRANQLQPASTSEQNFTRETTSNARSNPPISTYQIRRKGQPTVTVNVPPATSRNENSDPRSDCPNPPKTDDLLARLNRL